MSPKDLAGLDVLDAGCGNGQLTNALGAYARNVTGIDRSTSVQIAEVKRTAANVRYLNGDLNAPPFPPESFDLVYSSGVLHHNPDTARAFRAVAELVKPGGSFYCWLYRVEMRPIPLVTLIVNEPMRWIVCRLPSPLRTLAARAHGGIYHAILSILRPGKYTYAEHVVAAHDAICCRYAHRHTPFELARWFDEAGFDSPKLTHWDNGGGFGMVAVKRRAGPPAGVRFH